jgi:hypothetical protein
MTRPTISRSKIRHIKCSAVVVVRASGSEVVIKHDDATEMARIASETPSEPGDAWFYVTARGYRKPWPPEAPRAESAPPYTEAGPPAELERRPGGQFAPPAAGASASAPAPAASAPAAVPRWVATEENLQNVVRMVGHIYADAFDVAHKNVRVTFDALGNALVALSNRVAVLSDKSEETEKELTKLRSKIGTGDGSNDDLAQLAALLQSAMDRAPSPKPRPAAALPAAKE